MYVGHISQFLVLNLGNVFPTSFLFCPLEFMMGGWGTPTVCRKFSFQSCKALRI